MRAKKIVAALVAAVLVVGALALVGCGSKGKNITGEWKMENSQNIIYVITDTAITGPGGTAIPYKLGDKDEITLFAGETKEITAKYELSDDGKTLSIIEPASGSSESSSTGQGVKTVFIKVSDNKDAEPRMEGASNEPTNTGTDAKKNDAPKDDKAKDDKEETPKKK